MCGIFGFALRHDIPLAEAFKVLEKLEVHQYPLEPRPVGGYGAGLALLEDNGGLISEKVGKVSDSPAEVLSKAVPIEKARILVAHVRMPSPQFMETARFRETAQPYVAKCSSDQQVVSVHNGYVENHKIIREELRPVHALESEKIELIDSEDIPHLFEKLLREKNSADVALHALFSVLEGSNTVGLLQVGKETVCLHLVHKGKTRGLTVWVNEQGEIIFCSRKEPLIKEFGDILDRGGFVEKAGIRWREEASLKLSFPLALRAKG